MGDLSERWDLLIMDRDRATCEALGATIAEAEDFRILGYALTARDAKALIGDREFDFVVASSHLPTEEILNVSRWLRERGPRERPHLLVTGLPEDEAIILRYLESGASGFTLGEFTVEGLRLSMRLLARGEALVSMRLVHLLMVRLAELAELVRDRGLDPAAVSELTSRERDVLELLNEGLTNREAAKRLYVSEGTVKSHVHQILRKLKVKGRKDAVRVFRLQQASQGT
ncbi:MAG: response regulator transcription factor [Gemmatimonadota bacterium]|jgi:DNA-binding NarL/FixJ family response regulator